MLLLFKRNDGIGLVILIFVAIIFRLAYMVMPPSLTELGDFYTNTFGTFGWLKTAYLNHPRLYIVLSSLFWLGFSLYFKQILANEKLIHHRDFTPAIALFLIISALPPFAIFSVSALAAVCLFIALGIILGTPYNKPARSRYFLVGFFIGLAASLYWPSAFAFLAAIMILLSIRLLVVQELLALILGFLFPVYLIISLYYVISGNLIGFHQLAIGLHLPYAIQYKIATQVFIALIIILAFYGLYVSRNKLTENKLQIIKKWNGVVLFLFISLLISVTAPVFPSNTFVFALIPFSIILCSALINNHKKYNTFTFYLVLILVLALQWVLRFV